MILTESPRRRKVTQLVAWGHWFALSNIVLAMIISSVYLFSSPSPGSWLGNGYMVTNWFGHISFITFFGFVIFILPQCYLVQNEKVLRLSASVVSSIGLSFLAFDALLYTQTGAHFTLIATDVMADQIRNWPYLILLFLVWLGAQLLIGNALWKRLERLSKHRIGAPVTSFFVFCFIASHMVHVWADANLYQPIIKQDNLLPLSYPATAKTTMSRYGLLDLERYKEKEALQFSSKMTAIKYPANPIYCAVDAAQPITVLVQTDDAPINPKSLETLSNQAYFYRTEATSSESLISRVLFGLPDIYTNHLFEYPPVVLALPQAQGIAVGVSGIDTYEHPLISGYKSETAQSSEGLHIAFTSGDQIEQWITRESSLNSVMMVITARKENDNWSNLHTSFDMELSHTSAEDIAPTLLALMGCNSAPSDHSTGRNLTMPQRKWLVTTDKQKVILVDNEKIVEINSNGSYEITEHQSGQKNNDNLRMDLFTQAMKHLTRFSSDN